MANLDGPKNCSFKQQSLSLSSEAQAQAKRGAMMAGKGGGFRGDDPVASAAASSSSSGRQREVPPSPSEPPEPRPTHDNSGNSSRKQPPLHVSPLPARPTSLFACARMAHAYSYYSHLPFLATREEDAAWLVEAYGDASSVAAPLRALTDSAMGVSLGAPLSDERAILLALAAVGALANMFSDDLKRALVDRHGESDETLLHIAARLGSQETVQIFLFATMKHAPLVLRMLDAAGLTPLQRAVASLKHAVTFVWSDAVTIVWPDGDNMFARVSGSQLSVWHLLVDGAKQRHKGVGEGEGEAAVTTFVGSARDAGKRCGPPPWAWRGGWTQATSARRWNFARRPTAPTRPR